jgi:hypothetical protein
MTRPAMIIGLGGTGQQILTFLKKELLEIGGDQLPKEVKLLAFDMASRVNAQGIVDQEKVYRLGNIMLDENKEYVCIRDNLFPLVQKIKIDQERVEAGQPAQLAHLHWFPAKEFLERSLSIASFEAGQIGSSRALGRLCLFQNAHKIHNHIRTALADIKLEVNNMVLALDQGFARFQPIEIIVVSSLAGGTGAGIFIDIAWLIRLIADELIPGKYLLRGFFLLPTTFTAGNRGVAENGRQGRGFAAWRELDRALLGNGNQIVYDPVDSKMQIICDKPAYDITYLIDPDREQLPIFPPPIEGIYPAVAHLISFLLDQESGSQFAQYLAFEIYDTRHQLVNGVYHSAIGGYTLKVPTYYTKARFSHKLAQQVLDVLLSPEKDRSGRVTHLSRPDRRKIEADVHNFLVGDYSHIKDKIFPNTKLLQIIGQHRARKAREDRQLIVNTAQGVLTTSLIPYFEALCWIPEDDHLINLSYTSADTCSRELRWKIWNENECPPRRKRIESPEAAWNRLTSVASFRSVPNVRKRRFGVESIYQSADPKLRGEFGSELEKLKAVHLLLFRQLLHAQTLQELNRENPDSCVARGGKLVQDRGRVFG